MSNLTLRALVVGLAIMLIISVAHSVLVAVAGGCAVGFAMSFLE